MAPLDLSPAATGDMVADLPLDRLVALADALPPDQAVIAYRAWLHGNPAMPQRFAAWFNLGVRLAMLGDRAGAADAYRQALLAKPDLWQAAVNLGLSLEALGDGDGALAAWQGGLQPAEARTALLNHQGRLLEQRKDYAGAEQALLASLLADPRQPDVIQHWSHIRQKACLWPLHEPGIPGLPAEDLVLQSGPLGALALTDDVVLQRRIAEAWITRKVPAAPAHLAPARGYRHDRIRVGYLSSDFCRHAMGTLIVELLERHDRSRFEVFGYCSSREDGSDLRRRLVAAMDHHVPIAAMPDEDAARRIRADEIDILVDLNGLTAGARLRLLRWKPAPVQATYLGYIGPVPLPELDWLICDSHVVPPQQALHYAPRPLPLDGLYQANDSRMPDLPALTRAEEGLPEDAFVLCCFNNFYKITESVFEAWLEILRRLPRAVLWLAEDNALGEANLRARARLRGVDPARILVAPRTDPARYLARLRLADLFLDTTPYNAGTVASDALRMGLPLVTLSGRSFASRMAGALLRAVGLPGLAAETVDDYVAIAVGLGEDPARHAGVRAALAGGEAWRRSIGDSAGFTKRMEAVLEAIRLTP
ncbi:O-linked N-acetylglucosamine transferase, SPINDLY family protein [Paracraurococcus ruber]|uniref:protein O-GlcNAc transferase n=1 Tax=Paracraurococcus ruber TaxID=77675 RepID=A0ABS1CXF3_9PROT|nr:acetylglucosamine transferase [Paracraurococcus ruber]MBK1659053.1 acetylglucosamine transferase [Paracraurococcus ruber]TDG30034.1 acetylglucosamine transferase [Paracraurococcus ruber]